MCSAARSIQVREDRCIGCLACQNSCSRGYISCVQEGAELIVSFSRSCDEESCIRCAENCSEDAISIGGDEAEKGQFKLRFALIACRSCGVHFMPETVFKRLTATLAPRYGVKEEQLTWLHRCPECRRLQTGKIINMPEAKR